MKIVSFIGLKNSGKTTCVEALVREFKDRGLTVAVVKSMIHASFSISEEGKDTGRFTEAGADVVVSLSEGELVYIEQRQNTSTLDDFIEMIPEEVDVIVCEGLRDNDERITKILVVESLETVRKTIEIRDVRGDILAITGKIANTISNHDQYPVFNCTNDRDVTRLADLIRQEY